MRDIREASVYENYTMPKLYIKQYYCVEAAVHQRIVRVRSVQGRRIRDPPPRRPTGWDGFMCGGFVQVGSANENQNGWGSTSEDLLDNFASATCSGHRAYAPCDAAALTPVEPGAAGCAVEALPAACLRRPGRGSHH
eukprot:scaffold154_cov286-Pinguiococcus_pyrenoidosus.AAC.4